MKTFQQFINEGKNKDRIHKQEEKLRKEIRKPKIQKAAKKVFKQVEQERTERGDSELRYGHSEPNSPERLADISAMMRANREYLKKLKSGQP